VDWDSINKKAKERHFPSLFGLCFFFDWTNDQESGLVRYLV